MIREVQFYKTVDGKCPTEEFLDSLSGKVAQKVIWVLKLFEDIDIIPKKYFKKLSGTDGLWECRIKQGSNIYRIFAFFNKNNLVLTHGIIKKSQRTPRKDIEKAQRYKDDYFNRIKEGN